MNLNKLFDSMTHRVTESRTKELAMDLEDPLMSDEEFETKYGDSRETMQSRAGRVQDRRSGEWYDPAEKFDQLKNSPEFRSQMQRMARREGMAEGDAPVDFDWYRKQQQRQTQAKQKPGVAEAATPASVSKVLRLIERHKPEWFEDYGIGEVEDAVVDMAEQGQFQGMSAQDAMSLVAQELESMYGPQGMTEAIPYALSAANANAEHDRTRTHIPRGYTGRVDTQVSDQEEYRLVMKTLKKFAQSQGQHVEVGLSGNDMSIYSKTMDSDELSEFVDTAMEDFDQGMSEASKEKTPGVALSKAYQKDFDGIKPVNRRPETALTGTYSKTGKPGGELKKRSVGESYPKHQDLSGISTEKLKAYLAKQSQQQVSGEGNQVKRVRAELQRRSQGVAEGRATNGPITDQHKAASKKAFDAGVRDGKAGAEKNKEYMSSELMKTTYLNGYKQGKPGVSEGGYPEVDHMPGPTIKRTQTGCKRCHGKGYVYKTPDGETHPMNRPDAKKYKCGKCAGIGFVKVAEEGVAEASLEDRLKKYVRPVVKTTPKIERTTNPAGRTTDHVEWKVTGPMGDVTRFSSKKAAQAHYDSFGKPGVAEDSKEKSEPWVDAKLKRRMDYAFGHYSGYKDRPEAFFKWIMNSIDHSEQNDQQHNERFARVEREIARLQSRLQTVNEQHGAVVANRFSQRLAQHLESDRPQQDHTQQYFAESRTAKRAVIKEILSQRA